MSIFNKNSGITRAFRTLGLQSLQAAVRLRTVALPDDIEFGVVQHVGRYLFTVRRSRSRLQRRVMPVRRSRVQIRRRRRGWRQIGCSGHVSRRNSRCRRPRRWHRTRRMIDILRMGERRRHRGRRNNCRRRGRNGRHNIMRLLKRCDDGRIGRRRNRDRRRRARWRRHKVCSHRV